MKKLFPILVILIISTSACNIPAMSGPPQTPMTDPTNTLSPPAEHRIGIREVNGDPEFYDRVAGQKFYPRGAALWRWKQWPRM